MRTKNWVIVSAATSVMVLLLSVGQVLARENRPIITIKEGDKTLSLPILSVLDRPAGQLAGAVIVPRKAGESEAEYQERFDRLIKKASSDGVTEIQPLDALTYYMYTDWNSTGCVTKSSLSSSTSKTGSTFTPIDYIKAKTRLYSGGDLIKTKTDAHSNSSFASAAVEAVHFGCTFSGGVGTHEFRESGYETVIDETVDGNPF